MQKLQSPLQHGWKLEVNSALIWSNLLLMFRPDAKPSRLFIFLSMLPRHNEFAKEIHFNHRRNQRKTKATLYSVLFNTSKLDWQVLLQRAWHSPLYWVCLWKSLRPQAKNNRSWLEYHLGIRRECAWSPRNLKRWGSRILWYTYQI